MRWIVRPFLIASRMMPLHETGYHRNCARSAFQTWTKIIEILAPDPASAARAELRNAAGVACASISSEAIRMARSSCGVQARVRIYCVFDDDAITGDDVKEDALPRSATDGDWQMSIPCQKEDVSWSSSKLATVSDKQRKLRRHGRMAVHDGAIHAAAHFEILFA